MPTIPGEYTSWQSIATLGGASGLVFAATAGLKKAFGLEWKALPLLLSFAVVYIAAFHNGDVHDVWDFLLISFNAFVLYMTATGVNEAVIAAVRPDTPKPEPYKRTKKFLSSWLVGRHN